MVVGLGNPGSRYAGTRHNVGFDVLDRVAAREGAGFARHRKWDAEVAKLPGGVLLVKPQTFMNLSGRAVGAALRFYKLEPREALVVYDDVSLPLGQLRFRMSGGAGGHNGIKSLLADLGTPEFPRLKVGIGGGPGDSMTGHVLGRFRDHEREEAENMLARAAEAVQLALSHGVEAAANQFNIRQTDEQNRREPDPEIREPDRPRHEGE
ncbi:MAG: aminoacyl-tRNA hydrolase [Akkermansiaceae bacterium]|nr:aminoacyl-tRNA hydrolase [Akkermansiaceae bacterium]NNM29684.1 aminoacyl-tRNA hydrolase [Akkermansiaceae bacterium]